MARLLKPKILEDIQSRGRSVFNVPVRRVNLNYVRVRRLPLTPALRLVAGAMAVWLLVGGSAVAPTTQTLAANATSQEERAALEEQLRALESQIDEYESQVSSYQKQGTTLKGEVARLNSKIAKLNLQIKAINLQIGQLDQKITETEGQITTTEEEIDRNKTALARLLNEVYQSDQATLLHIFLKNPKLSDFFSDLNSIALVQGNLRLAIREISDLRDELEDQKEQYALARADAASARAYQAAQKLETDQVKQQQDELLRITKGQESKYQQLVKETKQTAAQIRSRIFTLLGGGELTFEEAYDYAKLASGATGVRPALILAVLDRESALGKNVGKCSYQTAMSPKNQPIFLQIVQELGINPETMMVSCPNRDGVYGGAMGPAQFIPTTWLLYREKVAQVTGRSPASPWNNADAFVATALYMAGAGAANATSVAQERKAAARYYAGGNWSRYLWTYGEAVVTRAARFEEDIAAISG